MESLPQQLAEPKRHIDGEGADRKVTFKASVDGQQEWTFE